MEVNEVIKMLDMIQVAYPKFAQHLDEKKMKQSAALWYEFFKNEDSAAVLAVLNEYIATNPFPPSVADLKGKLKEMSSPNNDALWDELVAAAENAYGYDYMPVGEGKSRKVYFKDYEYGRLSPPLKRFVGSANGLEDFRRMLKEDALKARGMFDRKIDRLVENCRTEELQKQVTITQNIQSNEDNIRKLEQIGRSLFKEC